MTDNHPLSQYVPAAALSKLTQLLDHQPLQFIIEKERSSKHGDYRPPVKKGGRHRITVNGSLNQMSFLLTTLHEYAHFTHRQEVGPGRLQPHGADWKRHFRQVMQPFLVSEIFPEPLLTELKRHMKNPKASSTADVKLLEALMAFDPPPKEGWFLLRDIEEGQRFVTEDGKLFKKGSLQRQRILCLNLNNERFYRVHPLLKVRPLP